MLEFILARYNYWIVIVLMMTGLYIIFSRGNLIKTIVGLNVFQTSVFIFYITLSKVSGGTAPIFLPGSQKKSYEDKAAHHGPSHGHQTQAQPQNAHGADHGDAADHVNLHTDPLTDEEAEAFITGERANSLEVNEPSAVEPSSLPEGSLHDMPEIGAINRLNEHVSRAPATVPVEEEGITLSQGGADADAAVQGGDNVIPDAAYEAAEIIYSNPLPHVLILTAIVVGVATTAVGLALAVRIREAYGTIEEDALERMDNEATTGSPYGEGGSS